MNFGLHATQEILGLFVYMAVARLGDGVTGFTARVTRVTSQLECLYYSHDASRCSPSAADRFEEDCQVPYPSC